MNIGFLFIYLLGAVVSLVLAIIMEWICQRAQPSKPISKVYYVNAFLLSWVGVALWGLMLGASIIGDIDGGTV